MYGKKILFGLLFVMVAPFVAAAQPAPNAKRFDVVVKDVDATLHEDWFGIYQQGKKIGCSQDVAEKVTEKGQTFYRIRKLTQVKVVVLGQKSVFTQVETLDFAAQAPFALLRGEQVIDTGDRKIVIRLTATDKGYEAILASGQKKMLNIDYTLADALTPQLWLKKGPVTGDTVAFRSFSFEELSTYTTSLKLLDIKQIVHQGASMKVREVELVENLAAAKQTSVFCYDNHGRPVSGLASGLEIRRESETEAKKIEFGNDVVFTNMAKLDRPVGLKTQDDVLKVKGLTLQAKGKIYSLLPNTACQSVTHEGNDVYVVKIGKHYGKSIKATDKEIQDGLAETVDFPIHDAKIVALAKKVIGDAKTDQEKVKRLCKFVNEYLTYEIVLAPSVHDIIERKTGECKAHSLLFGCLARAVGVPTRDASGYFYLGDTVKGFGQHYWNEVVIDGHWVPVDATIGHTDILPFYICVGTGADVLNNMTQTHGKLSFELVDVYRVP
ncbi:MAG TPA: transglutaminase-like domain-containing protein [Gemmataceae bacterium]|nr:transglutaminase-like domain-containing protein [Gemmataceae bacterium]